MAEPLTESFHLAAELDILLLSNLPATAFDRKFVRVGTHNNEDVFIRTIIINKADMKETKMEQKPIMVLVHGYAACSGLFFHVINRISKYFRLIMIDMVGYGASSRPLNCQFDEMSAQDFIDYFVDYFEAWRKEMNLDKFYLVGHSMGAYLSAMYTIKYPSHILKLALMSPPGMAYPSENSKDKMMTRSQRVIKNTYQPTILANLLYYIQKSPLSTMTL